MKKTLCIIPARGGSKGIPNKNIIEIGGLPLITHSILPAIDLKNKGIIDKVIVSTDSEKIAEVAFKYGAEIPFLRPQNISDDKAKSVDLIKHAIEFYLEKNINFDSVLLLQPTSPLRTKDDIENSIELYNSSFNDSLISVYQEEYINDLVMYKIDKDGKTSIPLSEKHNKGIRRQEHGAVYVRNGCIYISSVDLINQGFVIGNKPLMYIMPKSQSINLDGPEDLEILNKLLSK